MLNRQRELDKAGTSGSKEGDFDAESFERQMMNNEHGSLMGSKEKKKKDRKVAKEAAKVGPKPRPSVKAPKRAMPIIMLPQGRTALINMINGIQFMQHCSYLDEKARVGVKKPDTSKPVVIERKLADGRTTKYQLVDQAKSLQPQDWARVVMVVIQGPEWQFKGWKWEKEGMSSILDHACGFHIQYEDEETPPQVKNWACKVVKISKHKRHQDRMKAGEVWKHLDSWCANKGSRLSHLAL